MVILLLRLVEIWLIEFRVSGSYMLILPAPPGMLGLKLACRTSILTLRSPPELFPRFCPVISHLSKLIASLIRLTSSSAVCYVLNWHCERRISLRTWIEEDRRSAAQRIAGASPVILLPSKLSYSSCSYRAKNWPRLCEDVSLRRLSLYLDHQLSLYPRRSVLIEVICAVLMARRSSEPYCSLLAKLWRVKLFLGVPA